MTTKAEPAKGLLDAVLKVQAEATTFAKDRTVTVQTKTGGEYSYSYTPLDTIVETIGPLLKDNGLVWMTLPGRDERGDLALTYRLAHAPTGEVLEGQMPLMLADDADAQSLGSAITYMRRYALCAVLNLVADADDDGAGAGKGRSRGSSKAASEKQIKYVRTLVKKNKVTVAELRVMLRGAGVEIADDANVVPVVDALTGAQASSMIEFLQAPIPEGTSDVPSDASEFEHEKDTGPPLFDPSVPA